MKIKHGVRRTLTPRFKTNYDSIKMSNLFDSFASTLRTETTDEATSQHTGYLQNKGLDVCTEDSQETDSAEILDLEALNAFTIPKKKRKREAFEQISVESRSFKDVDVILKQSFKNLQDRAVFAYTKCYLLNNEKLQKEYVEKRKEMKKDGKDVQESYAFQLYSHGFEAEGDCCSGVKVKNSSISCLGNPELGVYLCRHADVLSPNNLQRGFSGKLVIFKVVKGKVKSMVENWSGDPLDPTPHFDCHVSKSATASDAFESSQIYFYEYDEFFEIMSRPRQVLPYALLHFNVMKDQKSRPQPASKPLTKQNSSQRISSATSSSSAVPVGSTAIPLLSLPVPSPRSHGAPTVSQHGGPTASQHGSRNVSETATSSPKPATPVVLPAKLDGGPTRLGKPPDDGDGVVVWSGNLTNNALQLCEVDMIAFGSVVKPALLGQQLRISKTVNWNTLLTLVLNNVVSLSKDSETKAGDSYYSYYRLKALPPHVDMFKALVQYFRSKQRGAYVELEDAKIILLPTCEITHNFQLTVPAESLPDVFHCIFISPCPREMQLKGRLSAKISRGSPVNGMAYYSNSAGSSADEAGTDDIATTQTELDVADLQSVGQFSCMKEPPKPSRKLKAILCFPDKDFLYEGGFKGIPTSTCRLDKRALELEFLRQVEAQDRRNIEEAKKARNKDTRRTLSGDKPETSSSSKVSLRLTGLESLKNQPLFSEFPMPDASNVARDPRVWRQSLQNSSVKLAGRNESVLGRGVHVPAKESGDKRTGLTVETSRIESGVSEGNTPPMNTPPPPPHLINKAPSSFTDVPQTFVSYLSPTQSCPATPPHGQVVGLNYPRSSQTNVGFTPPVTKQPLLPTPPPHHQRRGGVYGNQGISEASSEVQSVSLAPNQNLEQGPSVGQIQPQSQVTKAMERQKETTQIIGPIPTEGLPTEQQKVLVDSPLSQPESPGLRLGGNLDILAQSPLKPPQKEQVESVSHSPVKTSSEQSKPVTHSPHKSLVTSLPLPPIDDDVYLGKSETDREKRVREKGKSKTIRSSAKSVVEKKVSKVSKKEKAKVEPFSSSSDDNEELLTDDVVDDIIKLRPVKGLQSLQASKQKEDQSDSDRYVKLVNAKEMREEPNLLQTEQEGARKGLDTTENKQNFKVNKEITQKEKQSSQRDKEPHHKDKAKKTKEEQGRQKEEQIPKVARNDEVLMCCVSAALHKKTKPKECGITKAREESWNAFWSVALHYLLDLHRIIDGKADQAAASAKPKPGEEQESSAPQRTVDGKPVHAREMKIYALKAIRDYYDIPDLTNSMFASRLLAFKERTRELMGRPRFIGYKFKRSSLEEVAENLRRGNEEELEEYEFTEKDVRNFQDHLLASREEEAALKHPREDQVTDRNANNTAKNTSVTQGNLDKQENVKRKASSTVTSSRQDFTEPPASPSSGNDEQLSNPFQSDGEDSTMATFRGKLGSEDGDWPELQVVDVSKSKRVYSIGNSDDLPSLLNRQVIKSRDPRLSPDLPTNSVYNGLADSPQEPDSPDSFHSADWSTGRAPEPKGDAHSTKVHVNPKFFPKLLSSGGVPQDDVSREDILRENVGRGGEERNYGNGHSGSLMTDTKSERVSAADAVQSEGDSQDGDLFDDEVILLQQDMRPRRPPAEKESKRLKKEKAETPVRTSDERPIQDSATPVQEETELESFQMKVDMDPDEEILLQQGIGRRPKKDVESSVKQQERRRRREKTEKNIQEADKKPRMVPRPESSNLSPHERPLSRNSERSLGSLEQEKARIEEMLLREHAEKTSRSVEQGTPQRQAIHDDAAPAQAAERSHMARRTVQNIAMKRPVPSADSKDQKDRGNVTKTEMVLERDEKPAAITSFKEDIYEMRGRREMEGSVFERRASLDQLMMFQRSAPVSTERLAPLSAITRDMFQKRNVMDTKYTDTSYLISTRDMIDGVDMVCQGARSRYDKCYGHLNDLSVQTQLEASMTPDFALVKRVYFESLRDWMRLRPLDALLAGRLRTAGLKPTLLKTSRMSDDISGSCQRMLAKNMFYLLKGNHYRQEADSLFQRPADNLEEVGNDAFRQVRHYMDFVASKQHGGKIGQDTLPALTSWGQSCDIAFQGRMATSTQDMRFIHERGFAAGVRTVSDKFGFDPGQKSFETRVPSGVRQATYHRNDARRDTSIPQRQLGGTSPKSSVSDMYSPTRPTENDDTDVPLVMETRKRKVSSGEGMDAKKTKTVEKVEKKKSKKRSKSRSKSPEKSKDKDSRKKKEKKHRREKEKEKLKHGKRGSEGGDGRERSSLGGEYSRPRERKSEGSLSRVNGRERKVSESESRREQSRISKERKTSESDKAKEVSTVPKEIVPKVIPAVEVITKKQREQAKEALKKCAAMFFENSSLLKFANAYGYVPEKRRESLGEVPSPKPTGENTYATAWCILQFFKYKENMKFSESTKELVQFVLSDLDPENGFIWASLLALQENIANDVTEYAVKNKDLLLSHASADDSMGKGMEKNDSDGLGKAKKGGNKLMLAFRQVLQEKKRAEMGLASKSSTLSKLTPEQAAKKPAPKPSKPLFKPPIAYQLEKTDPDHETGVQREFYSISDIIKLSDNKLMDELVKKQVLAFLRQTLEAQENIDPSLSQTFQESLQPIVLKNIPSVRNLLNIASTFVAIFKEKQAESMPDIFAALFEKAEVSPPDTNSQTNEYGTSTSQITKSPDESALNGGVESHMDADQPVDMDGPVAKQEEIPGYLAPSTGDENALEEINEYGSVATQDPWPANECGSVVTEYGSVALSVTEKGEKEMGQTFVPRQVRKEPKLPKKVAGTGDMSARIPGIMDFEQEETSVAEIPTPPDVPTVGNSKIENTNGSVEKADVLPKRQFRKRQDSDRTKFENETLEKAAKVSEKQMEAGRQTSVLESHSGLPELSEMDDRSDSALQKFRKIKENKESKSSLDVRIAAILGDETTKADSVKDSDKIETSEQNSDAVNVEASAGDSSEVMQGTDTLDDQKDDGAGEKPQIEINMETPPEALPVTEDAKKAFAMSKKPTLMRNNKLLQAFKQQKSGSSQRHACTTRQRVTASDILARLQSKDRPATPTHRPGTPTQDEEVRHPTPMEIEEVSSPRMDENEDLYQQVFSKDSETLDLPMDSSPIDTSLNLAPGSDDKPKAVIGKAAVMYKAAEPSQGIQSLATAVPPSASMQDMAEEVPNTEEMPEAEEEDVPRSAAALLPPPPVDIPLPPASETPPPPEPASPVQPFVRLLTSGVQSYSSSSTSDSYSQVAEYAAQYAAQNQYTEYPPATSADTSSTTSAQYSYDYSQYPGFDYTQQWGGAPYQHAWSQYYQQQGEAAPGYSQWQQWNDWSQQSQSQPWGQLPRPPVTLPDMSVPPPGFNPSVPPPGFGTTPPLPAPTQKIPLLPTPPLLETPQIPPAPPQQPRRNFRPALLPPPPSRYMRFYVFNKEKKFTRTIEHHLMYAQAKMFDPYNIQSSLQQPVQCFIVFINRYDVLNLHMVPNLLQLKQEANIQFALFKNLDDFKFGSIEPVLVKGGQLIADDAVLFETQPETVGNILKYMLQQSKEGTPWSFKIHRKTLNLIRAKKKQEGDADQERCRRLDELIGHYGERGVVEALELHECDSGVQPSHAYLQCCLRLQSLHVKHFRHSLFLTKMPSNEAVACPFLDQGIGVISVHDFVQNILGEECPAQLAEFPLKPTPKEKAFYCDAILSTGIDRLDLPFYDPDELLRSVDEPDYHQYPAPARDQSYPPPPGEPHYQAPHRDPRYQPPPPGVQRYQPPPPGEQRYQPPPPGDRQCLRPPGDDSFQVPPQEEYRAPRHPLDDHDRNGPPPSFGRSSLDHEPWPPGPPGLLRSPRGRGFPPVVRPPIGRGYRGPGLLSPEKRPLLDRPPSVVPQKADDIGLTQPADSPAGRESRFDVVKSLTPVSLDSDERPPLTDSSQDTATQELTAAAAPRVDPCPEVGPPEEAHTQMPEASAREASAREEEPAPSEVSIIAQPVAGGEAPDVTSQDAVPREDNSAQ